MTDIRATRYKAHAHSITNMILATSLADTLSDSLFLFIKIIMNGSATNNPTADSFEKRAILKQINIARYLPTPAFIVCIDFIVNRINVVINKSYRPDTQATASTASGWAAKNNAPKTGHTRPEYRSFALSGSMLLAIKNTISVLIICMITLIPWCTMTEPLAPGGIAKRLNTTSGR